MDDHPRRRLDRKGWQAMSGYLYAAPMGPDLTTTVSAYAVPLESPWRMSPREIAMPPDRLGELVKGPPVKPAVTDTANSLVDMLRARRDVLVAELSTIDKMLAAVGKDGKP